MSERERESKRKRKRKREIECQTHEFINVVEAGKLILMVVKYVFYGNNNFQLQLKPRQDHRA